MEGFEILILEFTSEWETEKKRALILKLHQNILL